MVAPQTGHAVGVDIVCSAVKAAAGVLGPGISGRGLTTLVERKVQADSGQKSR